MSATKRALHALLSKVAHYAEFDVDDVASSLWKGSLVLRNVRFRAETLKSTASLGLTVKSGSIALIEIEAPWSLLQERHVRVLVQGVDVELETCVWQEGAAADFSQEDDAKRKMLEADFEHRRQMLLSSEEERAYWLSLFLTTILSKVEVTIEDVSVRLNDAASKRGGAGAGTCDSIFGLELKECGLVADEGDPQGRCCQVHLSGLRGWWSDAGAETLELLHTGAVATMKMCRGPEQNTQGTPHAADQDAKNPALLSLSVGVEETRVNVAIGALRSGLDLLSHITLVHTRRHALLEVRHNPAIVRPKVRYHGHAKEWWRYVGGWTMAVAKERGRTWTACSISQAVKQGREYRALFQELLQLSLRSRDTQLVEEGVRAAEVQLPVFMILALREAVTRNLSPPPESAASSSSLFSILGEGSRAAQGEEGDGDLELRLWGERVPVAKDVGKELKDVMEGFGVDLTGVAARGMASGRMHWLVSLNAPKVHLSLVAQSRSEGGGQVGTVSLVFGSMRASVVARAGGGWEVDVGIDEAKCVCTSGENTSGTEEVMVVEMGKTDTVDGGAGREGSALVRVRICAPGAREEADGQRHQMTASLAPLQVCVRPRICMMLGAWFQHAAAVVAEEDRFAVGDVSALALVAADAGRRGALAMLRQAILTPWAGQQDGGRGWDVSMDLDSPLMVICGDDYDQKQAQGGPVLNVRGGRIMVERSGEVECGQRFVAEWSGCDASIILPCTRGGDTKGGVLWAPITGKAVLLLMSSDSSRKCVLQCEVDPVVVSVTEGHVAAAAAIIQRFAAATQSTGREASLASSCSVQRMPRSRGLGASLAVALQNMAARSALAAERFNWFRLLQAGLKKSKKEEAKIVQLELDVLLHVKEVAVSLDFEKPGKEEKSATGAVPALSMRVQQFRVHGSANKSCLTLQAKLGALSTYGSSGPKCNKKATTLLEGGTTDAEGGEGWEDEGNALAYVILKVINSSGDGEHVVGKVEQPHVSIFGRMRKVSAQLPADAVTNGCHWFTQASAAVLDQPSLAAAARSVFQPADPPKSPPRPGSPQRPGASSIYFPPEKLGAACGSNGENGNDGLGVEAMNLSVDLEAEGLHVMLPKESDGGSLGVAFAVGKIQVIIVADVRSQTEPPAGEVSVEFLRCTMRQSATESWQLIDFGADNDVAARVTIGKNNEGFAELRAKVGKSEVQVSREDLSLLTQCTFSIFRALVASYNELLTLETLIWGGKKHAHALSAKLAGLREIEGGNSTSNVCASPDSKLAGTACAVGETLREEALVLPAWAMRARVITDIPLLTVGLLQSRIGSSGVVSEGSRGSKLQGGRLCVLMKGLKMTSSKGLMMGHVHVNSIQATFSDTSAGREKTSLCFPVVFELVPDDTPPGQRGQIRGIHELHTDTHGLEVDWGPLKDDQDSAEEKNQGANVEKRKLDVAVRIGRVKVVLTKEPLIFVGQAFLHLLALVRRGFESDRQMTGIFFQLLRLLDPTPAAPIGFLKDLRALVESRVAARDAPHEPSTQITEERYHYNGRLRLRLSSFQLQVMLEGTNRRSKGLFLSFRGWMTHRWSQKKGGGAVDPKGSERNQGSMEWKTESQVGLEKVDLSFNPCGSLLRDDGLGLCPIVKCDILLDSKEEAEECLMSLSLYGGVGEEGKEGSDRRVRVTVGSQEVLAAMEFALLVHSIVSKGSELLTVPADKALALAASVTAVSQWGGFGVHKEEGSKKAQEGAGSIRPTPKKKHEITWKLMRHKIDIESIEVVFLDDLSSARRASEPIVMLVLNDISMVHVLRDYVDEVFVRFSVSLLGLETTGSLVEPLIREPLLDESTWELSIITDGFSRTQKVQGRCDKVVELALASSYVRLLARVVDTTSHFVTSLRDQHLKMHEQEINRDTQLALTGAKAGIPDAVYLEEDEMYDQQDGALVRSMLDCRVWLKIEDGESGEVGREVSVPPSGKVFLGLAGLLMGDQTHNKLESGRGANVSIRLKIAAEGDWSEPWTPDVGNTHMIMCPRAGGDGSFLVKSMLVVRDGDLEGMPLQGHGEVLILFPLWRMQNLLPMDLSMNIHAAAPEDVDEDDNAPAVVDTVLVRSGHTSALCWQAGSGADFALSVTLAGYTRGTLAFMGGDFSRVGAHVSMQDKTGHTIKVWLALIHTVGGAVPTVVAYAPVVFVNRTGLSLVVGYRLNPPAESSDPAQEMGDKDGCPGPGQGSRLVLASCAEDVMQDAAEEGQDDMESWVARHPVCLPLSPPGVPWSKGTEELGISLKGSPFWTFLGRFASNDEEKGRLAGMAAGVLSAGTASAVKLQAKDPAEPVYALGVQVDMGAGPLHRTMYISLVPRVTVFNRCGEQIEVRRHVPLTKNSAALKSQGSHSGTPGILIKDGKLSVIHEASCSAESNVDEPSDGECFELRAVNAEGAPLTMWSGPCTVSRSGNLHFSVRLVKAERAREGTQDRHLVVDVKAYGAALFVHVTREEEATCLYTVDNVSGYLDVSVYQKGSPFGASQCVLVETGESKSVALDCPDLPAILIIQPAMLDAMEVNLSQQGAHGVLPTRDGSDTYIHWVVALRGRRRVVELTSRVGAEALDDYNPVEWEAKFLVPGVSLSLLSDDRLELLYAQVSGIELKVQNSLLHLRTSLRISKAQVDNQTALGPPTAFLSPAVGGAAGKSGATSVAGANFLVLEAELSHQVRGLAYWKSLSVETGPLLLQLQEDWLYLLLHFEKGTLVLDSCAEWAWLSDADSVGSGEGGVDVGTGMALVDERCLRSLGFILNASEPGAFLEVIRVDKISCEASVYGLSNVCRRPEGAQGVGQEGGGGGVAFLGEVYQLLGSLGRLAPLPDLHGQTIAVEPISVSEVLVEDPLDLVNILAKPIRDSWSKHAFQALAQAGNSQFWGSMIENAGDDDEEVLSRQREKAAQRASQKPATAAEGLKLGFTRAGDNIMEGLRGAVNRPLEGARKDGVQGFFKGVGSGALGLLAKPVAGMMSIGEHMTDVTSANTRIRAPRAVYCDARLRTYDATEADVCRWLLAQGEGLIGAIKAETLVPKTVTSLRKSVEADARARAITSSAPSAGWGLGAWGLAGDGGGSSNGGWTGLGAGFGGTGTGGTGGLFSGLASTVGGERGVRGDVPGTDTNGSAAVLVLLATSQRIALTWGQEEASAAAAAAVAKAPSPTPAPLPKGGWEMLLAEIENVEFGDGEVAVRSKKGVTMRAKCIDGEARRLDQFCQRLLLVLGTSPRGESGGN